MRKLISRLMVMAFAGCGASANASLITVDGKEWFQPADVRGYTWEDIAAICPTDGLACSGALTGGQDLTDWTWASANDVARLFNTYITGNPLTPLGGIDEYQEYSSTWAPAFFVDFQKTLDVSEVALTRGWSATTMIDGYGPTFAYTPAMYESEETSINPDSAWTDIVYRKDSTLGFGVWLYRPVPAPATLALFGLGLAGLGWSRRKRV